MENKTDSREALRRKVRYFYDLQKTRIALGNRTDDPELYVISVDKKTGVEKRTKKKATQFQMDMALAQLVSSFEKDTLAIDENNIETPALAILDEEDRLFLRRQNLLLESLEADTLKRIQEEIKKYPIYSAFLTGVKGCGPTMSGVILSEIQMAYEVPADTLEKEDVIRKQLLKVTDENGKAWDYVQAVHQVMVLRQDPDSDKKQTKATPVEVLRKYFWKDGVLYRDVCPTVSALWAYAGLAVDTRTNTARRHVKGERSNWNPFLKTKMLGVLGGQFIKYKNRTTGEISPYREIYDNYKHRLQSRDFGKNPGHVHKAALRVAVKYFLQDLWLAWRRLEGFPTTLPYKEAMLGRVHGDHGGTEKYWNNHYAR